MNRVPTNPSNADRRPTGFTLLEVLIAAVLTAVLLAGLWSLLGIYSGLYEKSQDQTGRAQLARSLQKLIADDLQSVLAIPVDRPRSPATDSPPESAPPSSDSAETADDTADPGGRSMSGVDTTDPYPPDGFAETDDSQASDAGTLFSPIDPTLGSPSRRVAASAAQPVGLVGSQYSLQLDVMVPVDPYLLPAGEEADDTQSVRHVYSRVPELQRISYTAHGPDLSSPTLQSSGLVRRQGTWERAFAIGPAATAGAPPTQRSDVGLSDIGASAGDFGTSPPEGDRISSVSGRQSQVVVAGQTETVDSIPEVANFQLRYFDGTVWRTRWNSREEESLPVAVEVLFDLLPPEGGRREIEMPTDAGIETREALDEPYPAPTDMAEADTLTTMSSQDVVTLGVDQLPQHRFVVYLGRTEPDPPPTLVPQAPSFEGEPIR
jgi:prepilin-type N-terminal cleavage/methylation domain-containing protein